MPISFACEDFAERHRRALEAMAARAGYAAAVQAGEHVLTGYDGFGYCFFQCVVLRAGRDVAAAVQMVVVSAAHPIVRS